MELESRSCPEFIALWLCSRIQCKLGGKLDLQRAEVVFFNFSCAKQRARTSPSSDAMRLGLGIFNGSVVSMQYFRNKPPTGNNNLTLYSCSILKIPKHLQTAHTQSTCLVLKHGCFWGEIHSCQKQ